MADVDLQAASESPQLLSRKVQIIEVCIFLMLIVPSMILSLFALQKGGVGFRITAISLVARDVALTGLVLFFLWRNGEPLARIGWTPQHWRRQIALGILLFPLVTVGASFLEKLLQHLGLSVPAKSVPSFLSVHGSLDILLGIVLVTVVAVAEETIFRGYLILRFDSIVGSVRAAVLLSSTIFSIGHGYEGSAGLVTVGVLGLVFAVVYLRTGSLVAPMVMHFLQDFIGIVLSPLLSGRQ